MLPLQKLSSIENRSEVRVSLELTRLSSPERNDARREVHCGGSVGSS